MEYATDNRVLKVLSDLKKSKITLVEWETPLLERLGYPLAPKAVCKRTKSFDNADF